MSGARLAAQMAALAVMPPAQLPAEWHRVWKAGAPRLSADLLRLGIAYRLQEKALGSVGGSHSSALRQAVSRRKRPGLAPGTQLVRSWNGRSISVMVSDDGYIWEDRSYGSLTAIAREVTGTNWSGPRFFGLDGMHG
ncbi:DUF2924 domain-containing protein [Sphingomonas sp. 1P06PA]|uniref:DUF2924 domain-containing protein n=1 Tax=Sphingomonas sp. 1P06PA TaxID=554121 RepID=UPI0039A62F48